MGDVLHGLPAAAALRLALPESYIGWAIEPHWMPLLTADFKGVRGIAMPVVDRVHTVPTREWKLRPFAFATLRQIAGLRREMRRGRYDVCVDLQGSIRSAVIGRLSGSDRVVGPRRPRERQARALYGERVDLTEGSVIAQACELLAVGAGMAHLEPAEALLPCDLEAREWCAEKLRSCGVTGAFVLLIPGAGWGAKRWPTERFAQIARQLQKQGLAVVTNSSSDTSVNAELAAAGAVRIESSVAQLIALVRHASVVIGGDTGPVHLAAALGRPVVALFGPTDPLRNGPHFPGARVVVLRHPASQTDHRRHPATEAGLAQIAVAEVFAATQQLLSSAELSEPKKRSQSMANNHG